MEHWHYPPARRGLSPTLLIPHLGKLVALVVTGVMLSIAIVIVSLLMVPQFDKLSTPHKT